MLKELAWLVMQYISQSRLTSPVLRQVGLLLHLLVLLLLLLHTAPRELACPCRLDRNECVMVMLTARYTVNDISPHWLGKCVCIISARLQKIFRGRMFVYVWRWRAQWVSFDKRISALAQE